VNTAGDALNVMRSLIGAREIPRGSNNAQPVTSWYGMKAAWCAMTVSYALFHSGHPRHVRFAYTPTGQAMFENGEWGTFHRTPRPGDLVFYSLKGKRTDHVGMIESVNGDGTYTSIEGNVGDACKRQRYPLNFRAIRGYGRPRYGGVMAMRSGLATGTGGERTLALGSRGEDVEGLQRVLVGAGHLPASAVNGVFGDDTKTALMALQRRLGLAATGIADPDTLDAIDNLLRLLANLEIEMLIIDCPDKPALLLAGSVQQLDNDQRNALRSVGVQAQRVDRARWEALNSLARA